MSYQLGDNLLETATALTKLHATRPRQADLRRAVSTTYYAMFHILCEISADKMVGGAGADKSTPAWNQVYRSLNHGTAKKQCEKSYRNGNSYGFPAKIMNFAQKFSEMQEKRHSADYDPKEKFKKEDVQYDIIAVKEIIEQFKTADDKDLRAFSVWVLFDKRR